LINGWASKHSKVLFQKKKHSNGRRASNGGGQVEQMRARRPDGVAAELGAPADGCERGTRGSGAGGADGAISTTAGKFC